MGEYASDQLKNDEMIVEAAVEKTGYALVYASEELKGNERIVLTAVRNNENMFQYASGKAVDQIRRECEKYGVSPQRYAEAEFNRRVIQVALSTDCSGPILELTTV